MSFLGHSKLFQRISSKKKKLQRASIFPQHLVRNNLLPQL